MTSADQPPSPYRREEPSQEESTGEYQAPRGGHQPGAPSNGAPFDPGFDQPPGSPFGSRQPDSPYDSGQHSPAYGSRQPDSPYGAAPYPAMPPYGEEQPYAGPVYGESPYEGSPYQASFGASTPYGMASYSAPPVQHPQATLALILGILGLAVCPFVGIAALVIGNKARKQIDAAPGQFTGRGMATAGFVLGVVSVALIVLFVLLVILGVAGALGA